MNRIPQYSQVDHMKEASWHMYCTNETQEAYMKKIQTVRLGDLIAAFYDEAGKETKIETLQYGIVSVALLDLRHKIFSPTHKSTGKHKKVA